MRWRRNVVISAGALAGAYFGFSALMARGLTRVQRVRPQDTPESVGLEYESVEFPSRNDGLSLAGWLIPPRVDGVQQFPRDFGESRWLAIVHGHSSNRAGPATGTLGLMRGLIDHGYGVLAFDLRGCGDSEGTTSSVGYFEQMDLLGALDFLVSRGADRRRLGVLGVSLGAVVALLVCAWPGTAAAVVADSAFADLQMIMAEGASGRRRALAVFAPGVRWMSRILYGIDVAAVSPAGAMAGSDTRALIIHGERDEKVPAFHATILARAGSIPARDVWIAPASGHAAAYRTHPEEYVARVTAFFGETLGASS